MRRDAPPSGTGGSCLAARAAEIARCGSSASGVAPAEKADQGGRVGEAPPRPGWPFPPHSPMRGSETDTRSAAAARRENIFKSQAGCWEAPKFGRVKSPQFEEAHGRFLLEALARRDEEAPAAEDVITLSLSAGAWPHAHGPSSL